VNELEKKAADLIVAAMGASSDDTKTVAGNLRVQIGAMDVRAPERDITLAIAGALERLGSRVETKSPWRAKVPAKAPKSNPGGYK
jgi:hypothetical protein